MRTTRVLLVDDEVPFVEALSRRLDKRKLLIFKAYGGAEALETLKANNDIDVVLLDVRMPGMGGIDVLREIKSLYPVVEVIMLTGHATIESAIEGMKLGAFDYLMKPAVIEVIMTKIQEAKAKKSAHEEKITQARLHEMAHRTGE